MEELISQFTSIARGMWRFRWPGLVAAWVAGIIGVVVVFRIPDNFEATARIYVDTQSILKPLMSGLAVQPNVDQQLGMLSRTLISRPNLEKLVRMADLDLRSQSKAQQEALIEELQRVLSIKSTGRDNLYSLSYTNSDKDKAKRVIQSMVSIFVESSLGASRKDTDSAKVFLDEQIKSYEAKLEEAEARVKEFRLRNLDMQGGDGKDSAGRLAEIGTQLETARLQLREAENSRDAAKRQLDAETGAARSAANDTTRSLLQESSVSVATPEIDGRIEAVRRNLDGLLQRFTEQHPDVVNARRLLKDLEDQKRKEVAELRKAALAAPQAPAGALPTANPAALEMSRLLATSEVQVAALKARVAEYQTRYAQAREASRQAPKLEAEAAQLNRDYAIVKKNYEDLVTRRQSAVLSGDLDLAAGVADFRLIDPPRVSPRPVSPNRLLLLPLALLAALVAGLSVALVASQLRPVYNDAHELRVKTGLPLLGVISMILSDDERKAERSNNLRFYAGTGGLLATFLVAMVTVSILATRQVG
jgi:polysaccharide chain length determinant protein (PEP-CTERM system associated)